MLTPEELKAERASLLERLRLIRERAQIGLDEDPGDWIGRHDALGVIQNLCDMPDPKGNT